MFWFLDTWIFGCFYFKYLDIWMFLYLDTWIIGYLHTEPLRSLSTKIFFRSCRHPSQHWNQHQCHLVLHVLLNCRRHQRLVQPAMWPVSPAKKGGKRLVNSAKKGREMISQSGRLPSSGWQNVMSGEFGHGFHVVSFTLFIRVVYNLSTEIVHTWIICVERFLLYFHWGWA